MDEDLKYLQLLSKNFGNIQSACTEIINLEAILNLPKGTEHFVSDLHGEYGAFQHVLRNASGVIKNKVESLFGNTMMESERRDLCTLIYYPEDKIKLMKQSLPNIDEWYKISLVHVIQVCQTVSSKYTRSKVRKSLPKEYSYIIEELMHESLSEPNKLDYINSIISTIISTGRAEHFISAICHVIQRLTIDSLHILGDIFDRGPEAQKIMETLCDYHNVDVQWGNHDLIWMGAAAGSAACMANVIRVSLRYANLETLENGYGINLLPLATFAMDVYRDDPCTQYKPKLESCSPFSQKKIHLIAQMHKAISIIQFKLEGELISRHPEFGMEDRKMLHKIDFDKGTIKLEGVEYELKDRDFETINPDSPYSLTAEEQDVVDQLLFNFTNNPILNKHIRFLYSHGSLYKVVNGNLLFHGSMPLNSDGSFKDVIVGNGKYHGKELYDRIDALVRKAYFAHSDDSDKQYALDYIWYMWCGPDAPAFDKDKMTTFERYHIADKATHKEVNGHYIKLKDDVKVVEMILKEFGLEGEHTHIINGHVPVKATRGETPIKAGGRLLVIDGGYSRAYQPETGIAGYTLIYNSHGLLLIQHTPFTSIEDAVQNGIDIKSEKHLVEYISNRRLVKDTDIGEELKRQCEDLHKLVNAFRKGIIVQH